MLEDTWAIYGLHHVNNPEIRYVGLTTRKCSKRFNDHLSNAMNGIKGSRFSWIRKYGVHNIRMKVLELGIQGDIEYLYYLERYWEISLREFGHRLLNEKPCGVGFPPQFGEDNPMFGKSHSQESKDKIRNTRATREYSAYWTGKNLSEDTKKKLSLSAIGRKPSEETRQKMSTTRLGMIQTNEHRENRSKALMGHEVSVETRQKISKAKKGKPSLANHNRWHVARDLSSLKCLFCFPTQNQST